MRARLFAFLLGLTLLVQACGAKTPAPVAQATPTAFPVSTQPLPPALVEVSPLPGSTLPLTPRIRFVFNQAMNQEATAAALQGLPEGSWTWEDDRTLIYQPADALPQQARLDITLTTGVQAANGLTLPAPQTLTYHTAAPLRVTETIPAPGKGYASAETDIIVTFNQPVVPLGADPQSEPPAFSLAPFTPGRGRWLNTSTYVFTPDQPLAGGQTYQVQIDPALQAQSGAALESVPEWQFTVALPELTDIFPDPAETEYLDLDAALRLTFSQPMDTASVEAAFRLLDENGSPIEGRFTWSDDQRQVTFTPADLLPRSQRLQLQLGAQASARGGGALAQAFQAEYRTWGDFAVKGQETSFSLYGDHISLTFGAPLAEEQDLENLIQISPAADCSISAFGGATLYIYCPNRLQRATVYTFSLPAELHDRWGQSLGKPVNLSFQTPAAEAYLLLPNLGWSSVLLVTPEAPRLPVQYARLNGIALQLETLDEVGFLLNADAGLQYTPAGGDRWYHTLNSGDNQSHRMDLPLSPAEALPTGFYAVQLTADPNAAPAGDEFLGQTLFLVSSHLNVSLKVGAQEALVWAVDARSGVPVANVPLRLYHGLQPLATGQTDENGLWQGAFPTVSAEEDFIVVLGEPGADNFGYATTAMTNGLDQSVYARAEGPRNHLYLYTDRPIYQPGQTIYFRGILRRAFDARYSLPQGMQQVRVEVKNPDYETVAELTLDVDDWGLFHGEYTLPADALPGSYLFFVEDWGSRRVQVAHYVKPTFELTFPDLPQSLVGAQEREISLEARYYFGAPVSDLPVEWAFYGQSLQFTHEGYTIGVPAQCAWWLLSDCADWLADGRGRTDDQGRLSLTLPEPAEAPRLLRLQIFAEDESGNGLNLTREVRQYPSDTLIGLKRASWLASLEEGIQVEVQLFSPDLTPLRQSERLNVSLERVEWAYDARRDQWEERLIPLDAFTLSTNPKGQASVQFIRGQGGLYRLTVEGAGSKSQVQVWLSGSGALFGADSALALPLQSERTHYLPGEQAQIFIPNPFGEAVQALVTLERGSIHGQELIDLPAEGGFYTFTLTDDHAPNIFVDVTLLTSGYRAAQGYLELEVEPQAQTLRLELLEAPQQALPGEAVTLKLRVTDDAGQPVQGRFSIALVDLAVLALSDDATPDIVSAYYAPARLGILQGVSGTRLATRFDDFFINLGMGGGGGGADLGLTRLRQDFRDTAYWNPQVETDANGLAQVTFTLPDNLTTWSLAVRGLTRDTRVGETSAELTVAKPLQVQPVTPSFFVVGDHLTLSALVFNNTGQPLDEVAVTLQPLNFLPDDPARLTQTVSIPARGRTLVSWTGTAQSADFISLLFSASGGGYEDRTLPEKGENGQLPVYAYLRPQTFVTAGLLTEGGSRTEVVSLPPQTDASFGALRLQAAPTLAGMLLPQLSAQPPASADESLLVQTYDWLMRLSLAQTLQAAGYQGSLPEVPTETVLARLSAAQREDGAWAWWEGAQEGHLRLTVDLLTALTLAEGYGVSVPAGMTAAARAWIDDQIGVPTELGLEYTTAELDLLAQIAWLQLHTGGVNNRFTTALLAARERLSPRGQAFLALQIAEHAPNEQSQALFEGLKASALRSASGAYWAAEGQGWFSDETLLTSAVVVYALAAYDPASPLLPDALRYLLQTRRQDGDRAYAYQDAWLALALSAAMQGSGELSANFQYSAALNEVTVLSGSAGSPADWDGAVSELPLTNLDPNQPNALTFQREDGPGRLYYRAELEVYQPAASAAPISRGLSLTRVYYNAKCAEDCQPLSAAQVSGSSLVRVELTLTVPQDVTDVQIEDYLPAGAQVVDVSLKTQAALAPRTLPWYEDWNWLRFNPARIYPQRISWTADYLPAGAYTLTYLLTPVLPGEFQVRPARAWLTYFPDVQAVTGGARFTITP